MPVYDYECHVCGHRFSEVMGIAEHETRKQRCPKCGSDTEPLIQAAYVATSKKS